MDPKTKELWIEALRSGQYKQGRCRLRRQSDPYFGAHDSNWCCLGVLCDVVDPTKWIPPEASKMGEIDWYQYGSTGHDLASETLPSDLMATVGLSAGLMSALIVKNDTDGWNFDKIADWIQENL